jgi:hypothetical protein
VCKCFFQLGKAWWCKKGCVKRKAGVSRCESMKNNTKGDTPMRANSALLIEPAQSWKRLQGAKEFFIENLDEFLHAQHKAVLEDLMLYERECFLNVHPYQRHEGRVDQANGFYSRRLTTRAGSFDLAVPRARSGLFHSQVIPRYTTQSNGSLSK